VSGFPHVFENRFPYCFNTSSKLNEKKFDTIAYLRFPKFYSWNKILHIAYRCKNICCLTFCTTVISGKERNLNKQWIFLLITMDFLLFLCYILLHNRNKVKKNKNLKSRLHFFSLKVLCS